MKIGLNLPNYTSLGYREAMIDIADAAEALGYSSLWTTDHILVPTSLPKDIFGNLLESLTTLSYLAARTERIGLGTGILVLPQRGAPSARSRARRQTGRHSSPAQRWPPPPP